MTNHLEAILFDMGGTLWRSSRRNSAGRLKFVAQILELLQLDDSPLEFAKILSDHYRSYRRWAVRNLIELNESDLWTNWMLPDLPPVRISQLALQLNQLWRNANRKRQVIPEAQETLLALFRRGYRLGLVSNTTSSTEAPEFLEKLKIAGCFEVVVLSCQVGLRKPDPDILLEATTRMGVDPRYCAYIGDRPDRDVAAANGAGFSRTVLLRDPRAPLKIPVGHVLMPDHLIDNLKELLDIFPARNGKKVPVTNEGLFDASFSTMWGMKTFSQLGDFFIVARRLGFSKIELNHQINSALLSGIALDQNRFSSIHEPCPADISVETLKERDWLISAQDEENRLQGVGAIKRSIDMASQLGARAIVIHAGNILPDRSLENRMRALYKAGQDRSAEYNELKESLTKARKEAVGPRFDAVKKSIKELVDYASKDGILLGLENRYYYLEFPNPDELNLLLDLAAPEQLGFIYDVGHAQALDRLGFYSHVEWLKRFAGRIIGAHLHDAIGINDHYAPGLGDVDFRMLASYLPKNAFRTLEVQSFNTPEQIKTGLKILFETGCINLVQ